jgi:hypothetical protein
MSEEVNLHAHDGRPRLWWATTRRVPASGWSQSRRDQSLSFDASPEEVAAAGKED